MKESGQKERSLRLEEFDKLLAHEPISTRDFQNRHVLPLESGSKAFLEAFYQVPQKVFWTTSSGAGISSNTACAGCSLKGCERTW